MLHSVSVDDKGVFSQQFNVVVKQFDVVFRQSNTSLVYGFLFAGAGTQASQIPGKAAEKRRKEGQSNGR